MDCMAVEDCGDCKAEVGSVVDCMVEVVRSNRKQNDRVHRHSRFEHPMRRGVVMNSGDV